MPPLLTGWLVAVVTHHPPEWIQQLVGSNNALHMAIFIALLTVFIFGVESLSQWGAEFGFRNLAQKAQHDLRTATYEHLQQRESAFFEQHRLGETMALLNDDVNQLERFLNSGLNEILS
nr:ABC transporter transmembrane domain-containing protein [Pseudomonadota bacterium]